jgi:hypothetical protein
MLRLKKFLLALMVLATSEQVLADQVQGLIRLSGTAVAKQVAITKETEFSGTNLCPGDKAKRLIALESMIVKVWGNTREQNGSKCFDVGSFSVLKTPAGREAIVGTLTQHDGVFQITTDDGRSMRLVSVPDGLKAMAGKKVIVDLKSVEAPESTQELTTSGFKAVYYAEFP